MRQLAPARYVPGDLHTAACLPILGLTAHTSPTAGQVVYRTPAPRNAMFGMIFAMPTAATITLVWRRRNHNG